MMHTYIIRIITYKISN